MHLVRAGRASGWAQVRTLGFGEAERRCDWVRERVRSLAGPGLAPSTLSWGRQLRVK
jgi:hypothetical protein